MAGSNFSPVLVRAAGILAASALAVACSGGGSTDGTGTPPTVATVAVAPAVDTLVRQQTLQLSATPRDAGGNLLSGQSISWNVTPASVATISTTGVLTAVATGTATVTATAGAAHGTATITVSDGAVVDVSGATVASTGGVATLVIPPHALDASTRISIAAMASPPAAPQLVPGTAFDFGPSGTQFAQPVTVQLRYNPAQVPAGTDPAQLRLFLRTGDGWTLVAGSSVDTAAHVISGTTTHFSGFGGCGGTCGATVPAITIGFASPGATLAPGASVTNHTGTIATTSYSGPITFAVTGMPAGLTATITQDTVSGVPQFTLQVTAAASVAPGNYTLTVTASGPGTSNVTAGTVAFPVIVLGSVNVHLDFSACDPRVRPIWVAYQDAAGPVTQVTGNSSVYNFSISTGKGALMVVAPVYSGSFETGVYYGLANELAAMPACGFVPPTTGKTVAFGDVSGVNPLTQGSSFSMPNGTSLSPFAPIPNVIPGAQDLLAFRYSLLDPTVGVRGMILRGIDVPDGSSIGPIDFNGAGSFAPATGTLTVDNLNDEPLTVQIRYLSEPNPCLDATYFMTAIPDTMSTIFGVPVSSQQPADVHLATISTPARLTDVWFHTFASQTVTLGAMLPTPVIQQQAGQYKRPLISLTLPSDYTVLSYSWHGPSNGLTVEETTGYIGSSMMAMAAPDFATLPGYSASWTSQTGSSGPYVLTAMNAPAETCTDGVIYRAVRVMGTN